MPRTYPAVFHSAWQAPDGRKAALLVNYTREAVSMGYEPADGLRVDLSAAAAGGEGAGRWRAAGAGVEGPLGARQVVMLPLR